MKLLILGGTMFVGRHLVEAALARGHEITLFNRGLNNAQLYPEIEKLRGDRSGDLKALQGRRWDAVIDTCGYLPWQVKVSSSLLADAVEHYTYLSSLSVYPELSPPGIDESSPTLGLTDEQANALSRIKVLNPLIAEKLRALYGHLKVLCERTVEDVMPGRVLSIRPGLIVGPYDYHESFTYWVHRVAQGGEVLAPGRPGQAVQLIDGRDLAGWIIQMVEARRTAHYNATGPNYALTMQHLLQECINTCGSNACLAWVSSQFLIEASATKTELPLWHPESRVNGLAFINCGKAIAAGLAFRPLSDTARDTLAWDVTRPQNVKRRVGLPPQRESQLLQAWHCQALASQLRN